MTIQLPISKSLAQRLLVLDALRGNALRDIPSQACDDIKIMHDILADHISNTLKQPRTYDLQDNGTAMRLLTAFFAQAKGYTTRLIGSARLSERPLSQLVDALIQLGANITYDNHDQHLPITIVGQRIEDWGLEKMRDTLAGVSTAGVSTTHISTTRISTAGVSTDYRPSTIVINDPESTQFITALLLIGQDVRTNIISPYIEMTKACIANYPNISLETDWSAAAFWYERCAIFGGEYFFPNLSLHSLQGDKAVKEIFQHFGVETTETEDGIKIVQGSKLRFKGSKFKVQGSTDALTISRDTCECVSQNNALTHSRDTCECVSDAQAHNTLKYKISGDQAHNTSANNITIDFSQCPDLYPAVYATCHRLGIPLQCAGTESLPKKESNRLQAMAQLSDYPADHLFSSFGDHRIAMALLQAGYQVDNTDCISKSYPEFISQVQQITFIVPTRDPERKSQLPNVIYSYDEGKGKKYALCKGISQATTPWVWLTDDDIERSAYPITLPELMTTDSADLYLMTLRMHYGTLLIEHLQSIEYEGIQNLTIRTAENGRPILCSGANLLVRKDLWLQSFDDLHQDIPSGDDMFLLEAFKRNGYKIQPLDNKTTEAWVTPMPTLRQLLRQRMRWAGKAPGYRDKDIILSGALVVLINMLCIICPILFIPKYLIERQFITHRSWRSVLLSLLYPFYIILSCVGGIILKSRKQW